MAESEFSLIARYFAQCTAPREDVVLGVGDDAALVTVPTGCELVVTTDTLVAGVHFPPDTPPQALGHKSLAVNLSDLAAMGADARWATLALTLPTADTAWLEGFAAGFAALAQHFGVQLIGGDTTRGPLSITVQALGSVPAGQALRRGGAGVGDRVFVSGPLGDAALALARGESSPGDPLRLRLDRPEPRLALGCALRGLASSAIDLSDGLLADLGHIIAASGLGAELSLARVPRSEAFRRWAQGRPEDQVMELLLAGGDDYELCFTVPEARGAEAQALLERLGLAGGEVGRIQSGPGLHCLRADGSRFEPQRLGFDHFGQAP
jgi:thiamine-monophosphate kinase